MPSWKKKISFGLGALLLAASMSAVAAVEGFTAGVNNKEGLPTSVKPGDTTVVRISLNNQSSGALSNVGFSDLTPSPATGTTFVYADEKSISCTPDNPTHGGTVTVTPDAKITLSGLNIPKGTDCYVDVKVKAVSETGSSATVTYTLGAAEINSDQGNPTKGGEQGFSVGSIVRPTWSKKAVSVVLNGDSAMLELKVKNNATTALTGVGFQDVFPTSTAGTIIEWDNTAASFSPAGCTNGVVTQGAGGSTGT